jgi:DNA-binding NtrC family response regulator
MSRQPRVLVVDDDLAHIAAVSGIMERAGYEVRGESTVEHGLRVVREERFDVVLMGYRFDHSEIAMTSVIGDFAGEASSGVIMLTAFADATIEADARLLGVSAFMLKPVNPALLIGKLAELMDDPTHLRLH